MDRKLAGRPLNQFTGVINKLLKSLLIVMICQVLGQFGSNSMLVNAFCPPKCHCQDMQRSANCRHGGLSVVPIMLNPRLESLDLADNQIKKFGASNPFAVYQLLKRLDLSRNEISHLLADSAFGNSLSKLEILNLDGNNISSLSARSLGLPKLRRLQLSANIIRNLGPEPVFGHLVELEVLDLSNNHIREMTATTFEGLKNLRTLSLRNNQLGSPMRQTEDGGYEVMSQPQISSTEGMAYGHERGNYDQDNAALVLMIDALTPTNLPNLTRLDLGGNHFRVVSRRWSPFVTRCANDQRLRRTSDLFSEAECDNPIVWNELKELSLDSSQIESIEDGSFSGLTSLLILKLNNNSLLTLTPAAFRGLTKLERLDLSFNPGLKTLEAKFFENLPNLKYLFLRGNNFTAIDEDWVQLGLGLAVLDFRDNALRCDCSVEPLQRILSYMKNRTIGAATVEYSSSLSSPIFKNGHQLHAFEFLFVRCEGPETLSDQLLINLDREALGCDNGPKWLTIIIIAIFIAALIIVGLCILAICAFVRYRRRRAAERRSQWRWKGHTSVVDGGHQTIKDISMAKPGSYSTVGRTPIDRSPNSIYFIQHVYERPSDYFISLHSSEKINLNIPNIPKTPRPQLSNYHTASRSMKRTQKA